MTAKTTKAKAESKIILSFQDFDYSHARGYYKVGPAVETTLREFCLANKDDAETCADVRRLEPGEVVRLGGGAQPVVEIKRMKRTK